MPGKGRPWVKGQSGNPAGRKKSYADRLSDALRERLEPEDMAERLDKFISAGSEKSLLYYFNRVLGMPAQAITVSGDAERPLHGLIGVAVRGLDAIEPPAPGIPARIEEDGEAVVEEEPDDTGGP